uniref:Uncharacterized protein n=1 Tax=Picea glauca TaxID=3330 RepID=A0A117NJ64_PICGL|nr:hypothetical protein ABT39_MTgene806 [Picea glauca]QHR90561.1 hypothetical protein Q903MT_gene4586 [Picea sitchensis]
MASKEKKKQGEYTSIFPLSQDIIRHRKRLRTTEGSRQDRKQLTSSLGKPKPVISYLSKSSKVYHSMRYLAPCERFEIKQAHRAPKTYSIMIYTSYNDVSTK